MSRSIGSWRLLLVAAATAVPLAERILAAMPYLVSGATPARQSAKGVIHAKYFPSHPRSNASSSPRRRQLP